MHQSFKVETNSSPQRLFEVLSDLSLYPEWLDLVDTADPVESSKDQPAWNVTLRAKLGPFARSKKLRMARTVAESPSKVRFERFEIDGREHSAWTMDALVEAGETPESSSATVTLAYGGELWSKALEAVLIAQVDDAAPKLKALAEKRP